MQKLDNTVDLTPTSEWDYCSAGELATALRSREISAVEIVDHAIARIKALDTHINAIVVPDFERARAQAHQADAALARGETGPLLGVPITIKESFDVAGLQTTWGLQSLTGYFPARDALVIARLRRAGAIVLGKTNVPTGLNDFQSYNSLYGTTRNPWDLSRTAGGSSGGSAAALAAGMGALSFGSDIGGSLRVPAHFCGIYAHKPSHGLVPTRGHDFPPSTPRHDVRDLAVIGPMTRCASDLDLALETVSGPDDDRDGVGYRVALPEARHNRLQDFRVCIVDTHPIIPISNVIREAIADLSERLRRAGAHVASSTSASIPNLAESARLYMLLLEAARSSRLTPEHFAAAQDAAVGLQPRDISLAAQRCRGTVMTHREWLIADDKRARCAQQWHEFFRNWDVVIYPSAAVVAFPHDHSEPIDTRRLQIDQQSYPYVDACYAWADPATTCGLPATAAPIDLSPEGLPIGIQIIGPYLEDRTPITFAAMMEREFGRSKHA